MISSRNDLAENSIEIHRRAYFLHHLVWSGIFPFGHFISDPHFISSWSSTNFPSDIQILLKDPNSRFQVISVNRYFKDKTTEFVLVLEANDTVYEYHIDVDTAWSSHPSDYVPVPFIYENNIWFLLYNERGLELDKKDWLGFAIVPLPLRHNQKIEFHTLESELSKNVIDYLKQDSRYSQFTQHMCVESKFRPYLEFYESNFEACLK